LWIQELDDPEVGVSDVDGQLDDRAEYFLEVRLERQHRELMQPVAHLLGFFALRDVAHHGLQPPIRQLPAGHLASENRPVLSSQTQLLADDVLAGGTTDQVPPPRKLRPGGPVVRSRRCYVAVAVTDENAC